MAWISIWWVWLSAALVLGIAEMLLPGFIFLGFAIGAAIMALIFLASGLVMTAPAALLVFAAISLVSWLALRFLFSGPKGQVKTFDHDIND